MNEKQGWDKHWKSHATIKRLKNIDTAYPEVVKLLLNLTSEKSTCIELGCGSGIYAIELIKNKRHCIASDFSDGALELTKLKGKKLYNLEVPTKVVDVYDIPFPENSFDLIFSDGLIEHLDIKRALKEMKRTLKPDGWTIAKVPNGSLLYKIVFHLLSPIENRPYEAWLSKKEWEKKFAECGYKNIKISRCGGILRGLAMRIKILRKFLKYVPSFGRIYFIIKAQK